MNSLRKHDSPVRKPVGWLFLPCQEMRHHHHHHHHHHRSAEPPSRVKMSCDLWTGSHALYIYLAKQTYSTKPNHTDSVVTVLTTIINEAYQYRDGSMVGGHTFHRNLWTIRVSAG